MLKETQDHANWFRFKFMTSQVLPSNICLVHSFPFLLDKTLKPYSPLVLDDDLASYFYQENEIKQSFTFICFLKFSLIPTYRNSNGLIFFNNL